MKNVKSQNLVPVERIENRIVIIRNQKVILDSDLATLYGVLTKRLNEAVKRNAIRFPNEFMFQLSKEEKNEVVANCDHLGHLKFFPVLPYVFTEYGALMAATVLNTTQAIKMSLIIIKTFVELRKTLSNQDHIIRYLKNLEKEYDANFKETFEVLENLRNPAVDSAKMAIGFNVK